MMTFHQILYVQHKQLAIGFGILQDKEGTRVSMPEVMSVEHLYKPFLDLHSSQKNVPEESLKKNVPEVSHAPLLSNVHLLPRALW